MKILYLNGNIFDLDQVVATQVESDCVRLTFRNGDQIPVYWRDETERRDILASVAPEGARC